MSRSNFLYLQDKTGVPRYFLNIYSIFKEKV